MKEITGEKFYELLKSEETTISNYSIIFSKRIVIELDKISFHKVIVNCKFNRRLEFFHKLFDPNKEFFHSLTFEKCNFNGLVIDNCNFRELIFKQINSKNDIFHIVNCKIQELEIDDSEFCNDTIAFHHNDFKQKIHFRNIKTNKTQFNLRKNTFPKIDNGFYRPSFINNCQFFNCDFYENNFGCDFAFTNNVLTFQDNFSQNNFRKCLFEKTTFDNTDFSTSTDFNDCSFREISSFNKIKNDINGELIFSNCNFKSSVSFNKVKIHNTCFKDSTFENIAYFQEAYFDVIKLDNSQFEKNAYFDDIQIKKIGLCDRRTIRNIKQQLQKAENRIDYNRFRGYELQAYYKELNWKNNFKDKAILWATKVSTGFEHSWTKALLFSLKFGFCFYILFFISENYMLAFEFSNWKIFISGYFRFLLITDFYNPLADGRTFIDNTNTIGWFTFILGKIVIAFGIYEMIQAFRKFKA